MNHYPEIGTKCFVRLYGRLHRAVVVEHFVREGCFQCETAAAKQVVPRWTRMSFHVESRLGVAHRGAEAVIPRDAEHAAELERECDAERILTQPSKPEPTLAPMFPEHLEPIRTTDEP